MASTSDIRNGLCIKYNNDIYKIIEFLHVKPGKGPAFVRTKLKSLTNGKVLDNTFSAGHKIDEVRVETHTFQYLYAEGDQFHFMNNESFEQITLDTGKFCHGINDTMKGLEMGAVETLLIWEELPTLRYELKVSSGDNAGKISILFINPNFTCSVKW